MTLTRPKSVEQLFEVKTIQADWKQRKKEEQSKKKKSDKDDVFEI